MAPRIARIFADIGRSHCDIGVVIAVPVAPHAHTGANIKDRCNGGVPPSSKRMHSGSEVMNAIIVVHAVFTVEAAVIAIIKVFILGCAHNRSLGDSACCVKVARLTHTSTLTVRTVSTAAADGA